ncbi:MAG: glycosyltransferase family 9 protein [Deltaproteobacteria bacterium]|nr:glycosyltransferase family 9 protein [Deltaproteobacteria bacterium]
MKKKVLIIRYGAYGDAIYNLALIEHVLRLFPTALIHVEANFRTGQILQHHPGVSAYSFYDPDTGPAKTRWARARERWAELEADLLPDVVVNLQNTIERGCVATDDMPEFWGPPEHRSRLFGNRSFYTYQFEKFGLVPPDQDDLAAGGLGSMGFTPEEDAWGRQWRRQHKNDFVIVMAVSGSTAQKAIPILEPIGKWLVDNYKDAVVYLAGDAQAESGAWKYHRTFSTIGRGPFRQLALMTRYTDLVIGPETGLVAAAGMWGTPKIYLATSSSVHQLTHLTRHDYSVQSWAGCSPCYRSCFRPDCCPQTEKHQPLCVTCFDFGEIAEKIGRVYETSRFSLRVNDFPWESDPVQAGK